MVGVLPIGSNVECHSGGLRLADKPEWQDARSILTLGGAVWSGGQSPKR